LAGMKLSIYDNTTLETIDEYLEFKEDGKEKASQFGKIIHSEVLTDVFERYWVEANK